MKELYRRKHIVNDKDFYLQHAASEHYDEVIAGDTIVYDSDTGQPVLVLAKKRIPAEEARSIYPALMQGFSYVSDNRGAYAGFKRVQTAKQSRTPPVHSYTGGFFERQGGRIPCCRMIAFSRDNPKAWKRQTRLLSYMAEVLRTYAPEAYERQKAFVEKIHPDYHLADFRSGTLPFTTTAVNLSVRAAYHRDKGDFKMGMGSMSVIMKGVCYNWFLSIPEYRVALDIRNRDIILFDPHLLHANTKGSGMGKMYRDWNRISIVGYVRQRLVDCLSFNGEVERARRLK